MKIDVADLDASHRRALEEIVRRELTTQQRLIISVLELGSTSASRQPAQSLDDWTNVYDGLSAPEIESIDPIVRTRADLTRSFPGKSSEK
ncbi:MAG: hypothetical protein KF777_14435 [Planctomycetaceae bacterium]|nr:hypothetical protein [Planctomycetaceae bacterium]